ncbi:hypothetical protein [Runella sp.]|uniref:hypothetical protein n=1 Tax=Runella sp. TaxID=1960881 RepID=UPI00261F2E8C|nr:hypothetical protein [Runella sp.]
MRKRLVKMNRQGQETESKEAKNLPDYPLYPPDEDIYRQFKKEEDIDPEDISHLKVANEPEGTRNEKDFSEDPMGSDLDVPGSELDNQQESVGSEDEENNYYSLGGDNHNDLEEDKGD